VAIHDPMSQVPENFGCNSRICLWKKWRMLEICFRIISGTGNDVRTPSSRTLCNFQI
jgi:hypothetical protein